MFLLLVAMMLLVGNLPAWGGHEIANEGEIKEEATRGFEEILDLWRTGNYGELYNRTLIAGKDTKESFSGKMAAAPLKPSCCWEKMQNVAITVHSPASVIVKAKLGLDGPVNMVYKTKAFKLFKEEGVWRIARAEIISLAEAKKKKGKKLPRR
jgi:hypothetical protein